MIWRQQLDGLKNDLKREQKQQDFDKELIKILEENLESKIATASKDSLPHALYTKQQMTNRFTMVKAELASLTERFYVQQAKLRELRELRY